MQQGGQREWGLLQSVFGVCGRLGGFSISLAALVVGGGFFIAGQQEEPLSPSTVKFLWLLRWLLWGTSYVFLFASWGAFLKLLDNLGMTIHAAMKKSPFWIVLAGFIGLLVTYVGIGLLFVVID